MRALCKRKSQICLPVAVKNILRVLDLELTPNAKIKAGSMKAIMAGG